MRTKLDSILLPDQKVKKRFFKFNFDMKTIHLEEKDNVKACNSNTYIENKYNLTFD